MIVGHVFDLLLKATQAEEKILHSEAVIRILKAVKLDPDHPPVEFDGIYAYALVEYAYDDRGMRKHSALIRLFRTETVKQAFRQALNNNAPEEWLATVTRQIDRGDLGRELRELKRDPETELITFARIFLEIVKRSRMPKELLAEQKLDSLQNQMQQMQQQIRQLPFADIQQSVTQLIGTLNLAYLPLKIATKHMLNAKPLHLLNNLKTGSKSWDMVLRRITRYGAEIILTS